MDEGVIQSNTSQQSVERQAQLEVEALEAIDLLDEAGLETAELSPQEAIAKAKKLQKAKKRVAQILQRGITLDTLDRSLDLVPKGFVGQFVRERDNDIAHYRALGFEVLSLDDKSRNPSSHGTADSRVRVGDCVLMVIPEEEKAAIDMHRAEQRRKRREAHDPKRQAEAKMREAGLKTFTNV